MDTVESCNNVAPLSKSDILSIIKSCHRFHVTRIKVGSLEIDFSDTMNDSKFPAVQTIEPEERLTQKEFGTHVQFQESKLYDIESELDQLMVTDPEAYEQIMDEAAHGAPA